MDLIWTIIVGFFVGLFARFFMPGRDVSGFIMTSILGIVGAVVGTYVGSLLGLYQFGESAGFIGSVLGAMIVLFIFKMIRGDK